MRYAAAVLTKPGPGQWSDIPRTLLKRPNISLWRRPMSAAVQVSKVTKLPVNGNMFTLDIAKIALRFAANSFFNPEFRVGHSHSPRYPACTPTRHLAGVSTGLYLKRVSCTAVSTAFPLSQIWATGDGGRPSPKASAGAISCDAGFDAEPYLPLEGYGSTRGL